MKTVFGNIKFDSLLRIAELEEFKAVWDINKTKISICSDCEYRTICTDCRAYIQHPNDIFSKPRKCKDDPYSGT